MKIFVLIVAIVSVVSAQDAEDAEDAGDAGDFNVALDLEWSSDDTPSFEWIGDIKTLVDTANYTEDDVLNITRSIFKDIPMNCQGNIGMPTVAHIPSPTDACDLGIMDELTKRLFKGYSDDYPEFLKTFWSSVVGQRFLREMTQKGVSEYVVKAALKETWFNKSIEADYPFNRLFLEADNVARFSRSGLNNWYTFEKDYQSRTDCSIETQGENLPVLVVGQCQGENYRHSSRFIIPSHPFVDLVIYSLCAWSRSEERFSVQMQSCEAVIPGLDKPFGIAASRHMDKDNKPYLQSAYPSED